MRKTSCTDRPALTAPRPLRRPGRGSARSRTGLPHDTGLALFLSGERELRGAHLENLVLEDLVAWRETRLPRPELFYWRTAGGREVDFVIESDGGVVLPVEVKATARPSTKDVQGLKGFLEAHGARAPGGVLLHTGSETFWIARDVIAAPWWTVVM